MWGILNRTASSSAAPLRTIGAWRSLRKPSDTLHTLPAMRMPKAGDDADMSDLQHGQERCNWPVSTENVPSSEFASALATPCTA